MAIYHLHAQIIKRSSGRSAVAAAAYRAGEKIHNDYDGMTHDYTRKKGVAFSEIMLPKHAPIEYGNRAVLWNAVEKAEKRKDSQTAREMDIALPFELDRQAQIQLVRDYIQENFVSAGMCADFAVHDKGDGNPHAHIMLTTREVSGNGFGGKNRDWNKPEYLEQWRGSWADICNERLQAKGLDERIDHRTLKEQGIEREPTIHEWRSANRKRENREIIASNKELSHELVAGHMHELKQGHFILDKEITTAKHQVGEAQQKIQSLRFRAEMIAERMEQIQTMRERLAELNAKRQCIGYFENKKIIDEQIWRIENACKQAEHAFQKEYYIPPHEAQAEVKRIEYKQRDLEQARKRLQDRLVPLSAEKDVFAFEYHRRKLLAGISPHEQSIQDQLAKLDKEALQGLSAQEKISYLRSGRILDIVPERSFQRLLDEVTPEQAYKLIKQHERERTREQQRLR